MPREKEGQRQRGIMAPEELWAAIDALAGRTGRTPADEVRHAMERHVASPPVVRVEVPALAAAEVVKKENAPKKRGRPPGKKGGGA